MSRTESWRDQRERRFFVDPDASSELAEALSTHLELLTYVPDSRRSLVVTTYLDSPDRDYLATIEQTSGHLSLKMRVREYLAVHDDAEERLAHVPTCFLERKERVGDLRIKQRVQLEKKRVASVIGRQDSLRGNDAVINALRDELHRRALEPVLVTCYERRVYGDARRLRVTLDKQLRFYAAPSDLYDRLDAFTPTNLGQPLGGLDQHILEVKEMRGSDTPAWLETLLAKLRPAERFSKFREGMGLTDGRPKRSTRATGS